VHCAVRLGQQFAMFTDWTRSIFEESKLRAVYLSPADKSHRLTRRLSQEQKGLEEKALMASQRPSAPW